MEHTNNAFAKRENMSRNEAVERIATAGHVRIGSLGISTERTNISGGC